MTEAEWLACDDVAAMLRWVDGSSVDEGSAWTGPGNTAIKASDRRLRLFTCACVRQVWHLLTDNVPCPECHGEGQIHDADFSDGDSDHQMFLMQDTLRDCPTCGGTGRINRSRRAVEVAERYADGEATEEEREAAWTTLSGDGYTGALLLGVPGSPERYASLAARDCLGEFGANRVWDRNFAGCSLATQASILRDLVGNPWRPVKLPPGPPLPPRKCSCGRGLHKNRPQRHNVCAVCNGEGVVCDLGPCPWITPVVLALARAAYEERMDLKCLKCMGTGHDRDSQGERTVQWCPVCHGSGTFHGVLDPGTLGALHDALVEAGCPAEAETPCPTCSPYADDPCPQCDGTGKVSYLVGNGRTFTDVCDTCNGTGKFPPGYHPERDPASGRHEGGWTNCKTCSSTGGKGGVIHVPNPILAHLRLPGPHVRGCWAVDLLLGKE